MTIAVKPITKQIKFDKAFDVRSLFDRSKIKPISVMIVAIPQYPVVQKISKRTKQNLNLEEAMEQYYNKETISLPSTVKTLEDFRSFIRSHE